MRLHLILPVVLLVGLSACSGNSEKGLSAAEGALSTCQGYATALNTLASFREAGKLSKGQINIVDDAIDYVGPYCKGPAPDVDAKLKDVAVDAGVRVLQSVVLAVLSK